MKLIQMILRRPATIFLLILAVGVFGVSSLMGMPLEYMPDMEMPMELVMVMWPGADADSIERLVTEPIETECESLTDINTISSTTYDNYAMVQLQYNYEVDLNDAYSELKAAMDNLAVSLPDGCEDPTIMEISMTAMATMSVSASSSDGVDVQGYLNDTVAPALESIGGVAKVDITGAQDEYLRIVLDESRLQQYGLTISSVGAAIAAADFDMPVGSVTIGTQDVALSAYGNIDISSPDMLDIPIQTRSCQMIQLRDVISIFNLYRKDAESVSHYNGQESVLLEVTKSSSASTISVCSDVEAVLNQLSGSGVEFTVISSDADNVMDTLLEVVRTLVIGVLLTMAVLFLFFGDIKASLIVGCSMPLSILLAIICLSALGFSFDLMTGTSLIIAIGMIVDNSIVILESCMRAQAQTPDFKEAAARGAGEMLMSIFAGTLTTVVVYVPLAMAQGMSGQMAAPLSWTISLTMLSSFLCAVTIVPLLFSMVKPVPKTELPVNRVLGKIQSFYRRVTPRLLRHPGRVVLCAVAVLAASLLLATQLNFVLFPDDYDGSIQVEAAFRSGTKLEVMNENIQELEQALLSDEEFENVTLDISGNSAVFTAYARSGCTRSSVAAVEEYTGRFGSSADMEITVTPTGSGTMSMSGMSASNTTDVTLMSDNMAALEQGAALVEEAMAQVPGVMSIHNDFSQSRVQGRLIINAQKAIAAGMSQSAVAVQANYFLNGMTAATVDYGDKEYDVVLEYPEGRFEDLTSLMDHHIQTANGSMITLGDIATVEYTTTLPSIARQDGKFITTVSAIATDASKFEASKAINAAVAQLTFPDGVEPGMSAMDKMSNDEISNMTGTLLIAVFLVFLVMAIQFNSPRLSIMVMLCIPFSLAGSFGAVFLSGGTMSILGVMGFLMLFGIAVNNGIYLVNGTNELRKTMPLEKALIEAGVTRLRPILMTTMTTVISMVPMLLSGSSGMGMMKEMAVIIIGGLVVSTILAMFLMPSFYLLILHEDLDGNKKKGLFSKNSRALPSESK